MSSPEFEHEKIAALICSGLRPEGPAAVPDLKVLTAAAISVSLKERGGTSGGVWLTKGRGA